MSTMSFVILICLVLLPGKRVLELLVKAITDMLLGAIVLAVVIALVLHATGASYEGPGAPDPTPAHSTGQPRYW